MLTKVTISNHFSGKYSIFLLAFFLLLIYNNVYSQKKNKLRIGRVINQKTLKPVARAMVLVKVMIKNNRRSHSEKLSLVADSDGFYSINTAPHAKLEDIKVLQVIGHQIKSTDKVTHNIRVVPTIKFYNYLGKLVGVGNMPISGATLKFGQRNVNVNTNGTFKINNTRMFLTPDSWIDIKVVGEFRGQFRAYSRAVIVNPTRNAHWFKNEKNEVIIVLPFTRRKAKYYVRNESKKALAGKRVTLYHDGSQQITNKDGYFETNIKLDKTSLSIQNAQIKDIDPQGNIVVKEVKIKKTAITAKAKKLPHNTRNFDNPLAKDLQNMKAAFKKKADLFLEKIKKLKQDSSIDKKKLESIALQFNTYQQEVEKQIRSFTRKMLETLLEGNDSLKKQFINKDSLGSLHTLKKLEDTLEKLDKEEERKNKAIGHTYWVIFLSLIFFACLVVWYLQRKRKNIARLNFQNSLINLLMSELNHRVANNLVAIRSKVSITSKNAESEEAKSSLANIHGYVSQLIKVQSSLDYSMIKESSGAFDTENIESRFHDLADAVCDLHFEEMKKPYIDMHITVDKLNGKKLSFIGFCMVELVNNVCKHAFRGKQTHDYPKINIKLLDKKGEIKLIVADNGRGIDPELFDSKKCFDFEKIKSSKGLKIINKLTKIENGEFNIFTHKVHSEVSEGSRFECNYKC